jgi:hypothetical protein
VLFEIVDCVSLKYEFTEFLLALDVEASALLDWLDWPWF